MMCRRLLAAVLIVAAGLTLAGCDSSAAGSPTAATTLPGTGETSEAPPSSESDRLSPPVENPKDLRGIDPCELLTPEQLTELTLTEPGEKDTTPWGEEGCTWSSSILFVGFSPDTTLGEGLDQAYRSKDSFDNFEVSSVDGYPAVRVNFATQLCGVIVGVSDDQALSVDFGRVSSQAPGLNDPCGFAETVAGMVLENLPDA
jgi:hypothetical protein